MRKKKRIDKKKATRPPLNIWLYVSAILFIFILILLFLRPATSLEEKLETVFEINGTTYVAYDHPLVTAYVIYDPACDNDLCDVNAFKQQILTTLTPAIRFEDLEFTSPEATSLINAHRITSVPAFMFDKNIRSVGNFEFIQEFFVERDDMYLLRIPAGKYIATPHNVPAHVKGSATPKVTVTQFCSFTSTFCAQLKTTLDTVLREYPDQLTIHFIHFNRGGPDTTLIHASECASEQGKFWEMHDALFARQSELDENGEVQTGILSEIGFDLGLDMATFETCMNDTHRFDAKLKEMQNTIADFSLQATPSLFANDTFIQGVIDEAELRAMLAE